MFFRAMTAACGAQTMIPKELLYYDPPSRRLAGVGKLMTQLGDG